MHIFISDLSSLLWALLFLRSIQLFPFYLTFIWFFSFFYLSLCLHIWCVSCGCHKGRFSFFNPDFWDFLGSLLLFLVVYFLDSSCLLWFSNSVSSSRFLIMCLILMPDPHHLSFYWFWKTSSLELLMLPLLPLISAPILGLCSGSFSFYWVTVDKSWHWIHPTFLKVQQVGWCWVVAGITGGSTLYCLLSPSLLKQIFRET